MSNSRSCHVQDPEWCAEPDRGPAPQRGPRHGSLRNLRRCRPRVHRHPGLLPVPGWPAPEQALGHRLTAASDVWGIGGLLYECIVGKPAVPHDGDTSTATGNRSTRLIAVPAPLRTGRRVPTQVARMIEATLRLDPAQRPTVAQCATVLAAALDVSPVPHVLPVPDFLRRK